MRNAKLHGKPDLNLGDVSCNAKHKISRCVVNTRDVLYFTECGNVINH